MKAMTSAVLLSVFYAVEARNSMDCAHCVLYKLLGLYLEE